MRRSLLCTLAVGVLALAIPRFALAGSDVDGGPDCGRTITDFGDAPEGMPLFGSFGPIAHFPTCLAPSPPGTQELFCPGRSTPPGITGYMLNFQAQATYWLGCYDPTGAWSGIDSESDGKVSFPSGPSVCGGIPTDCTLVPYLAGPISYGQDECKLGDGDAGVGVDLLLPCSVNHFSYTTSNCGPARQVYLNALIDMNFDGDWNDVVKCGGTCAYEWAVKNEPILLANGCEQRLSPPFLVGEAEGNSWMRVSITDDPVDDDYPWAGSANRPGGYYAGGETEDYFVRILSGDPAQKPSWGKLKTLYR